MKGQPINDIMSENTKPSKRTNTVQLLILLIAIISTIILLLSFYFEHLAPEEETIEPITIKNSLDRIVTIDGLLDVNSLSFHKYSDSLEWKKFDKSSYRIGEKIIFSLKINGMKLMDSRKVSAFLIDTNNFVRMSFPSLDSIDIINILNGNNTFQEIINSEPSNSFKINSILELIFNPEKTTDIISCGEWQILVIIWKPENTASYEPSLIITETVSLSGYEKPPSLFESILESTSFYTTIIGSIMLVILIIFAYWTIKKEKKGKEKNKK